MSAPHSLRSLRHFFLLALLFLLFGAFALPQSTSATKFLFGGTTTRVSVASNGTQGNGESYNSFISGDGRYIVFTSAASNLVSSDTNNDRDIFLHDRQTGITTRESVAFDGTQANNGSLGGILSPDGRYTVFVSYANNLVPNDNNGEDDLFLKDHISGTIEIVSLANDGGQGNNASQCLPCDLSGDGRFVVFYSSANNLVDNDTNSYQDVFVRDRVAGTTTRVSVSSTGVQANHRSTQASINADGRYVAFESRAGNLDLNDTNGVEDIYVHDRNTSTTFRVSVDSSGGQANAYSVNPSISEDGRYIVFDSIASNLVTNDLNSVSDVFVHDRLTALTERVSIGSDGVEGNGDSWYADLSADGQYIVFLSDASNLVAGDTNGMPDIFIYDLLNQETTLISISYDGDIANGFSQSTPSISDDGSVVAFDSYATNLVTGDTNSLTDVFVREWFEVSLTPTPTSTSVPTTPTTTPTETISTFTPSPTNLPTTPTPTSTGVPTTSTPTPTGIIPSLTPTGTGIPLTSTPTSTAIVPTLTPTRTPILPVSNGEVFIPIVLRQYAFATPPPATPTNTPVPTCEVLDHEPNNFFVQANANLPLCEGATVTGVVAVNDIDDFYRVQVDNAATVRIDLTGIPIGADYDLYLYDASGGPVTVSNNSGSVNEIIRTQLASGRYYIRVYSLNYADPNTYQLRWARE